MFGSRATLLLNFTFAPSPDLLCDVHVSGFGEEVKAFLHFVGTLDTDALLHKQMPSCTSSQHTCAHPYNYTHDALRRSAPARRPQPPTSIPTTFANHLPQTLALNNHKHPSTPVNTVTQAITSPPKWFVMSCDPSPYFEC